jgi:dynein heavy chain
MWHKNPEELVRHLDSCLKLNEAYQHQYRVKINFLQVYQKENNLNLMK